MAYGWTYFDATNLNITAIDAYYPNAGKWFEGEYVSTSTRTWTAGTDKLTTTDRWRIDTNYGSAFRLNGGVVRFTFDESVNLNNVHIWEFAGTGTTLTDDIETCNITIKRDATNHTIEVGNLWYLSLHSKWSNSYMFYFVIGYYSSGTTYTVTDTLTNISADSANPTEIDENAEFTLNYSANDGYIINSLTSNIGTVTIADDKLTATVTGTATENITVTGTGIEKVTYYTVTNTLTNISADSENPTSIEENTEFSLKYVANEGYTIDSLTSNIGTVTIAEDKATATITGTATENITVTGTGAQIIYTVVENLTNVKSDGNPTTVKYGETIYFEYSALSGYEIISAETTAGNAYINTAKTKATVSGTITQPLTITIVASQNEFAVTDDLTGITADSTNPTTVTKDTEFTLKYSCESPYTIDSLTSNIGTVTIADDKLSATVTGTATENITVTGVATAKYYMHITGSFVKCSCNYSDGELIDVNKKVLLTCDDGYTFGSAVFEYKDGNVTYQFGGFDTTQIGFTPNGKGDVYMFDTYKATKIVEHVSSFVNLYRCDNDVLKKLAQVRFVDDSGTTIDYGQYITKLFRTNIDIDSIMSGDTASIILGNYDSNVEAETPNTYRFDIELGTITVPEKYGNVYDYINTTVTLYVPFFSAVSLNVSDIIGKTVTIKLVFDLYNGIMTLLVYDSNDCIITNQNNTIVTNIPFLATKTDSVVNQLSTVYVQADEHNNARIKVTRNIPYDIDSIFGKEVIEFGTIGDYSGYIECSNCRIETTATEQELEQITSLLKEGVYIGN